MFLSLAGRCIPARYFKSATGKLFEPDIHDKKIVASSETAIMQHELLSWGITERGLQIVSDNDPKAKEINRIIDEWVENIPQADRKVFVNEFLRFQSVSGPV